MKNLCRSMQMLCAIALIALPLWLGWGIQPVSWAENLEKTDFINADNSKIDLNNSNINTFRQVPGMYPTLARIIVNNGPYESFDDVLKISGLSAAQIQKLKDNADRFTLKKPDNSMNRERINNALYRL
ncbi:MAG: photosystem II complex extrinsic protein PsbU [Pseudanabaenaceae cyanobacterium bins.68]|nr:photosystem II complex extrinsic protein PsbU [Pseudanabaenaceae cyanobacterium bins.68]